MLPIGNTAPPYSLPSHVAKVLTLLICKGPREAPERPLGPARLGPFGLDILLLCSLKPIRPSLHH